MPLTRRRVLQGTGAAAVAAATGPLTGCTKKRSTNNPDTNRKVELPTYVPYRGVQPDRPGNARGLQPLFYRYPARPTQAIDETPGTGGRVTAFTALLTTPPPPVGKNRFWQQLDKKLGVDLDMQMAASADYPNKLATLTAGGDLPDLTMLRGLLPQMPALLAHEFADLSDFVSGDAVRAYPMLAALPTEAWRSTVFDGGIYGVPVPRAPTGSLVFRRDDVLKERGLDPDPSSFAEFKELCLALTQPRQDRYATAAPAGLLAFVNEMLGGANAWRESDGEFTYGIETEQTRRALSATAELVKAGVLHPDSFNKTASYQDWFGSGRIALFYGSSTAWPGLQKTYSATDPDLRLGAMLPPNFDDNSEAVVWRGPPTFSFTALKKAKPDRIKELLRICNWLAAPFGTAEYLFRKYGVADVDYTEKGTDPVPTGTGKSETTLALLYLADCQWPIYEPGDVPTARAEYDYARRAIPHGVSDPTIGLFSDTWAAKGGQLAQPLGTVQTDVLQGRKPLSAWDDAVKTWRSSGGEQIKKEYARSYAAAH